MIEADWPTLPFPVPKICQPLLPLPVLDREEETGPSLLLLTSPFASVPSSNPLSEEEEEWQQGKRWEGPSAILLPETTALPPPTILEL